MPCTLEKNPLRRTMAEVHSLVLHTVGATAVRLLLASCGAGNALMHRIEIGTPLTSLLRLREGLFLQALGLSPYSGKCSAPTAPAPCIGTCGRNSCARKCKSGTNNLRIQRIL